MGTRWISNRRWIIALFCLSLVLLYGPATVVMGDDDDDEALFTPVVVPNANRTLWCHIVNVSDEARTVEIEVRSNTGAVLNIPAPILLQPGASDGVNVAETNLIHPRYCKFSVQGGREHFRASANVIETAGTFEPFVTVPAK